MEIHSEFPCLSRRPSRVNLRNEKRSISDSLGRRGVPKFNYQFPPSPPSVSSIHALYTWNPCCLYILHASSLVGVNTCTDQDYRCISWVRSNRWYCRTNQHVRTYCKKSCGLCPRPPTVKPTVRPRPTTVRPRPPTLRPTPPTKRPRPRTVRPRPPTLRPTPPTKRPTPTTKKPVQPSKRNSLKVFRHIL